MDGGFEDGGQGEVAPPQLGRRERCGRAGAEAHPEDGDLMEDVSSRKIGDALALAPGVAADAAGVPAPGATGARLFGKGGQVELPGSDRGDVVRQR